MRLIIRNLGAVKQIEVDLSKKLTLFCGPNNTGKTYVSYILHAFLSYKQYNIRNKSVISSVREHGEFTFSKQDLIDWADTACQSVIDNLGVILGISDDTKDKLFSKLELTPVFTDEDYQRALDWDFKTPSDASSGFKVSKEAGENHIKVEIDWKRENDSENMTNFIEFMGLLMPVLVFGNKGNVRMLTVERNSIYTFKTELSLSRNELIDRIQQSVDRSELNIQELLNSSSRRYPLAIRSSLRVANDLENVQKYAGDYADIAALIEQNLLYGEVSMTKNGDVEFHSLSMASRRRLPFHLSSSIVKTMASLVVFLRHLAYKNDILIIDEPEMNFHPDVQVTLARIFAMLVNRGLRIVISTHSDYIIREFNNLVMLDALRQKGRHCDETEGEYTSDMNLPADDLQVLLFQIKTKKRVVTVESQKILPTGFSVKTIDDTISRQNEIAQSLYWTLTEDETDE
jgi:ABC-type multidrug transport system ATPase subunit